MYSPTRAQPRTWLSGRVPYERAAEVFQRIGRWAVPATSIWRQAQQQGERLTAHMARQRAQTAPERVGLPPAGRDHPQPKRVSLDGGRVHVRGEGWKEFKAGAVYDLEVRAEPDPETGEAVEVAHGVHVASTAVLGAPDAFGPALWALAVEGEVPAAAESVVVADGAEWIWHLAADYFPDSVQIVDGYHATAHLAQAAQALHPDHADAARDWQRARRADLYLGAIGAVTAALEAAGLEAQAQYFHRHQRRMQYQEFREHGYPLGSGTVESGTPAPRLPALAAGAGVKQFKARLTGAGMRWSRPGADRMLVLRAAVLSGNFDSLWAAARNRPKP